MREIWALEGPILTHYRLDDSCQNERLFRLVWNAPPGYQRQETRVKRKNGLTYCCRIPMNFTGLLRTSATSKKPSKTVSSLLRRLRARQDLLNFQRENKSFFAMTRSVRELSESCMY
jgi:hypothetical protein